MMSGNVSPDKKPMSRIETNRTFPLIENFRRGVVDIINTLKPSAGLSVT